MGLLRIVLLKPKAALANDWSATTADEPHLPQPISGNQHI